MSILNLTIHSFSIIAVFKYTVFLRSSIIILLLSLLGNFLGLYSLLLQIALVVFNLIIFIVSFRENKDQLIISKENILNEKSITH